MINLKELQKEVMRNKVEKGFMIGDIAREFCRAHEELSEAFSKYDKGQDGVAEEFADVAIFLLGMCETLGYDLETEIVKKIEKNKKRQYKTVTMPNGKQVLMRVKTDEDP